MNSDAVCDQLVFRGDVSDERSVFYRHRLELWLNAVPNVMTDAVELFEQRQIGVVVRKVAEADLCDSSLEGGVDLTVHGDRDLAIGVARVAEDAPLVHLNAKAAKQRF